MRQENETLGSKPYNSSPKQYFDHQPASNYRLTASKMDDDQTGTRTASLPTTGGSFEPSVPIEGMEAIWFAVSRAVRLHAGPYVSSRITHFYPVGTELKLIGYEHGWFLMSDPATLRQGWIYERYYLQAIRGPGQTQLAVQDLPSPIRVALAAPEPKSSSRVKKIAKLRRPQAKIRIANLRVDNEFASLVERAFRGY